MSLQSHIGGSAKGGLDSARTSNCYTTGFFLAVIKRECCSLLWLMLKDFLGLGSVLLTFWEPEGDVTAEPRLCSGWQSTLQACFLKGISTAFHSAFSSDFLSQLSIYCTQGSSFDLPLRVFFSPPSSKWEAEDQVALTKTIHSVCCLQFITAFQYLPSGWVFHLVLLVWHCLRGFLKRRWCLGIGTFKSSQTR